jgi:hypothetical protein
MDRLDQAAADLFGLNRTDMRALDIIGRAGPLTPPTWPGCSASPPAASPPC